MQNVAHNSKCNSPRDSDLNEVGNDHSESSSPLSGNLERRQSVACLQSHFMAELSESEDDDDVSEVESFLLEQNDIEERGLDASKFLLTDEVSEGGIDEETQCRLEALLSASNTFFENGPLDPTNPNFSDPDNFKLTVDPECIRNFSLSEEMYNKETLKTLASSINCSLDESTAVLSRIRACSLVEAASHGDIGTVKKLLEEGRDVNEVTEDGESLLSLAASSGYFELAQLLLVMKANVEDRGLKDMTPLMEAANAGHLDIVKLLIQHGADVNAQTSQEKKLKGAKVKNQDMKSQQDIHGTLPSIVCPEGNTPLMFACAAGHEEIVKVLLQAGARVEDHNENGHTPLMEAASAGHVGVAKLLVAEGASINTHSNEFKESALTLACYKGHLEMVRFLLEAGADREHKTDEMHTALMEASMDGHVEVARLLLDSGAQVNMPADSFESPLTLAACGGHVELAMLLLDRGANIEEVNDEGYTPLMEAAREGHEEMVALLLSQGADINAQTEETQETALTLACCGGFLEVADFLIKAGADIELGASTPLMEAAQEGHLELVRYLITTGANVNATTATGDTALTYACENGHTDVADLLLQAYAKLEHESEGGRTPLMKAARAGHLCTVQFLISKGANVNKQTTNNDHNPLSLACAGGHLPIVELLLAHGADPTHKLKDNSTMLIEAAKGGHTSVVQLLLDYPNTMLTSPPPPPDLSQMSSTPLESNETPRVPPHGLPLFLPQDSEQNSVSGSSYLGNVQTVPRIQDILRDALPNSAPQAVPKQKPGQRKNTTVKSNEPPSSSFCENSQRYHYRSKTNAAAQANSLSIQTETGSQKSLVESDLPTFVTGGGGNLESVDDKGLKPSERLEACINTMMKKAEMLNPSPEEQILQKQQILEELQRVERELQEKAHAQLLLTAQHQHQNLQGLGNIVTGTPTITTLSNSANTLSNLATVAGAHAQQLILNSGAVLDIESLSSLTDISSMSSHLGLSLRSTTTTNNITFPQAVHSQQLYHQPHQQAAQQQQQQQLQQQQLQQQQQQQLQQQLQQQQQQQPQQQQQMPQQQSQQPKAMQQAVITTTFTADYCKNRAGKPAKQVKSVVKQTSAQQTFPMQTTQIESHSKPDSPQSHIDDIDKINLRNVVYNEQQQQQQQQQQIQLQQQLLHQHSQQQFVLSEFTQNLTLRGKNYCEGAIAGIMHAMGGIKLTSDSTQTHTIPIYDPITVGQALLQQQLQQQQQQHLVQHQQLTQVLQQEAKRQQSQPPPQSFSPQQQQQQNQPQHLQQQQHFEKNIKVLKGKTNKVQQQSLLHANPPPLTSLQPQQLIKQQFPTCGEACTLVGNIPIEGTGVLTLSGMSSPAFPVSIAVSPVSLPAPVSIATSCGTAFTHNLTLDEGLMVAAPARTLHETLGDIMTAPTTQLAGNPLNLIQQGHCSETCLNLATSNVKPRSLSLPGVSASTSVPLAFCNFAPSMTPCVPIQVSASSECLSHHMPHLSHTTAAPSNPTPPIYPPLDLNSQTDSNHDTALTLACTGGHDELVTLLLSRGADIEHRDKKGFTPLMLASSTGHAGCVDILLNHAADIEAQSERTKDTALSLGCSGGRYEVVDILLARGANKEHRNVSDYTPLSLAASGGYVNIIKLLLSHGAEINSRTGSKLGISPLMLAAMNGHTQAVRLLLDMGSDINAQIETNRNTALTLACFQGRHEVVNLLLERKANVEHRAKTGLTPLMEAASGGYVEVGKVLIDKGADVNAPPVPSSRDTALTIAADKGHYRFVQLLLERDAVVDVKNKKGNSPLWLAANGGHLEVVQLLANNNADIDSQDNRKVSCLMAAFRKGHVKVVKWMVKHVSQFPSDQEMARFMSTITDKELLKKCSQCVDTIRIAKERQAAEANKNANILLEELDLERCREENRKAAAARRRERKRRKKREKQEQLRAAKAAAEESKKSEKGDNLFSNKHCGHQSDQSEVDDDDDYDDEEEDDDEEEKDDETVVPSENIQDTSRLSTGSNSPNKSKPIQISSTSEKSKENIYVYQDPSHCLSKTVGESRSDKRRDRDKVKTQEKNKRNSNKISIAESRCVGEIQVAEKHSPRTSDTTSVINTATTTCNRVNKKKNQKQDSIVNCTSLITTASISSLKSITSTVSPACHTATVDSKSQNAIHNKHYKQKEVLVNGINSNSIPDYDDLCALFSQNASLRGKKNSIEKLSLEPYDELTLDLPTEVAISAGLRSPSGPTLQHSLRSPLTNTASPKKWPRREEGWKEVVRSKLFNRSKKVSVPANAISRVIGRGGMNINAIRESSGAHIEVEKQKGQGERTVIIRGAPDCTRVAQQLITALIKEPEKELSEILSRCGINRANSSLNSLVPETFKAPCITINNPSLSTAAQVSSISSQNKSITKQHILAKASGNAFPCVSRITSIPPPSLPANATPPFTNQFRSVVTNTPNIRPCIPVCSTATPPFLSNASNAWTGVVGTGKVPANVPRPSVPICTTSAALNLTARVVTTSTVEKCPVSRQLFPPEAKNTTQSGNTTSTKTTVSYTMAVIAQGKAAKTIPTNVVTVSTKVTATSDTKVSTISPITIERAGSAPPSSAVVHTQLPSSHNTCSGPTTVQPFASNHSPKSSSSSPTSHQSVPVSRIHISQAPVQSKPFHNSGVPVSQTSVCNNPPSTSPSITHVLTSAQSSIAQEYTPFNNIFAKVAQSVWGQKDKEASKPNFASVAAAGVTSVASQVQNSNPVQSSLTLTLPLNSESDLIIDAAKAPGYRGKLHISPSASSSSSASSNAPLVGISSANYGPIGSGPRSAPCTPPLGPIGPPSSSASSTRRSTPPAVPSPSPPPHLSHSLPETQNVPMSDIPHSIAGLPPSHQVSEAMYHHQNLEMTFHPNRLQSYPMAVTASPGGTNTTYSQHSPLSSVGVIPFEGGNNGPMQVVQSNLNPNAPDFSSRNVCLPPQAPALHHLPRLPSGNFPENSLPPHLQLRPILTSGGHNFPIHAMANAQAALNRFSFHHIPNHQQQAADFSNPNGSSGTIGSVVSGLSQGSESMPLLSMVTGYPHAPAVVAGNGGLPHHYPGLQSVMGIRPNHRSASTTPSVGTSSKDEGSPVMSPSASPQGSNLPSPTGMNIQENPNPAGTIGEDRKLPRPIGMERAQRKNPVFGGGVSDAGGIWSFSSSGRSEIPATGDWIQGVQTAMGPIQQDESSIQPSVHNYSGSRFGDVLTMENNHPIDQSYQQAMGSNVYPFMNGLPPHLIAPHLYQNNAAGQVDAQVEMWDAHQKAAQSVESMPQNVDQKVNWQNWSSHQA